MNRMMDGTTWRADITAALAQRGETWADVEACTLSDEQLDKVFDSGYGAEEGSPFTVWTPKAVYFPACYDGSEWVASVSRHPDGFPTAHIGGG